MFFGLTCIPIDDDATADDIRTMSEGVGVPGRPTERIRTRRMPRGRAIMVGGKER